jgi:nucleoside-diphosphate-sugar epimerase
MRLFVTGASGFIGSEVCRQAQAAGYQILPLLRPHRLGLPPWKEVEAFKPDVAIHCAWIATPGIYVDSPENFVLKEHSIELFRMLSRIGVSHFVGCGTCAEYAPSEENLAEETSPVGPASPYAQAKHELHLALQRISTECGTGLSWMRIFYPYGPTEHPDRLISSILRGFRSAESVEIRNPQAIRDYVHVSDVASALLHCALRRASGCFNVGTGEGVLLGKLESMVGELAGQPPQADSMSRVGGGMSNDRVVALTDKLRSLGWSPCYDVGSGLSTYVWQTKTAK